MGRDVVPICWGIVRPNTDLSVGNSTTSVSINHIDGLGVVLDESVDLRGSLSEALVSNLLSLGIDGLSDMVSFLLCSLFIVIYLICESFQSFSILVDVGICLLFEVVKVTCILLLLDGSLEGSVELSDAAVNLSVISSPNIFYKVIKYMSLSYYLCSLAICWWKVWLKIWIFSSTTEFTIS